MLHICIPNCITVLNIKFVFFFQLTEYMQHPEVHANNKTLAKKTIDFLRHEMGMVANYGIHPITKKQICVYSVESTDVGTTFME